MMKRNVTTPDNTLWSILEDIDADQVDKIALSLTLCKATETVQKANNGDALPEDSDEDATPVGPTSARTHRLPTRQVPVAVLAVSMMKRQNDARRPRSGSR